MDNICLSSVRQLTSEPQSWWQAWPRTWTWGPSSPTAGGTMAPHPHSHTSACRSDILILFFLKNTSEFSFDVLYYCGILAFAFVVIPYWKCNILLHVGPHCHRNISAKSSSGGCVANFSNPGPIFETDVRQPLCIRYSLLYVWMSQLPEGFWKGLSYEIDFKNIVTILQILASIIEHQWSICETGLKKLWIGMREVRQLDSV